MPYAEEYWDPYQDEDGSPDVWSFGVILHYLCGGDFESMRRTTGFGTGFRMLLRKGARPDRPNNVPDFSWDLIQRCWNSDVKERPSFHEIVRNLHQNTEKYAFPGADINALKDYENRMLSH